MKTKVFTIGPVQAATLLKKTETLIEAGKMTQRPISQGTVDQYARAMRSGRWVLHHQGIALAENGGVIDGRHRLQAIVQSNAQVEIQVTTEVPIVAMRNGYEVNTIDAVDRGRVRAIGQQLQISHGMKNGNKLAAMARGIAVACSKQQNLKVSVTDCLAVLHVYEDEIDTVCAIDPSWGRNTSITAGLVLGVCAGDRGLAFAKSYLLRDHKHNDPANKLRTWWDNAHMKQGAGAASAVLSAVAFYIKAEFENNKPNQCRAKPEHLQWLVDQQGSKAAKVRSLFATS